VLPRTAPMRLAIAVAVVLLVIFSACTRLDRDLPSTPAAAPAVHAPPPVEPEPEPEPQPDHDESLPTSGPFPTLAALCTHVLELNGNDAPRVCDLSPSYATGRSRLRPASGPFRSARVIAVDRGDFTVCSLALETTAGFFLFQGADCENTMNDSPYSFRTHKLAIISLPTGEPALTWRFTAVEVDITHPETWRFTCTSTGSVPHCIQTLEAP
jgi:hypothetical protein